MARRYTVGGPTCPPGQISCGNGLVCHRHAAPEPFEDAAPCIRTAQHAPHGRHGFCSGRPVAFVSAVKQPHGDGLAYNWTACDTVGELAAGNAATREDLAKALTKALPDRRVDLRYIDNGWGY
jgi:hypothetical protein